MITVKKEAFNRALDMVRHMCDDMIKECSRKGYDSLDFEVPRSIFTQDAYDPKSMGRALAEQLFEDGYDVTGTSTHLHVQWSDTATGASTPQETRFEPTAMGLKGLFSTLSGSRSMLNRKVERKLTHV
jgi:hypothetical protein